MTHRLRVVRNLLILSLLLAFSTRAQSYQTGTVVQLLFIRSADKRKRHATAVLTNCS
jgi:hypothetical protein